MAKSAPAIDSDDTTSYHTVFVDTSIDTHLATIVSNSDTVADLKQKIMHEHPMCFPQIGEIKVHALKVKRKGCFYHLSESMLVKSAFHGVNKGWFITVDASSVKENDDDDRDLIVARIPKSNNLVTCIATPSNGSADGVNLSLPSHPEKLSGIVDEHHLKLAPVADRLVLEVADRDFVENLDMRAEHTGDDQNKFKSREEKKCSDDQAQEKDDDQYDDGNEIQKTPSGGRESNSNNGISDVQGSLLPEKTSDRGSHRNKRRKSKKRNKHVRDLASKETVASLPESDKHESLQEIVALEGSLQSAQQVVSHDNVTRNKNTTDGPSMISYFDANKGTDPALQRATIPSEGTGVLVEDASQSEPVARKKRKIEEDSKGGEAILKDDKTLINNSRKGMLEPPTVSQHSLVDKQTITNAIPEAVHLQFVGPSSGKQKRKKKSSKILHQEIAASLSRTNFRDKSPADLKDSAEEKLVPGKHGQAVIGSESGAVPLKEKYGNPVQDVSIEFDINKEGGGNVKSGHNVSKLAIASDTKITKDDQGIYMEGNPHLEVQESDETENEIEASQHENMILDDYQSHDADQTDRVEEPKTTQNFSPKSAPSEKCKASSHDELDLRTSATECLTKSPKKRKKSKKKKALACATPFTSITEHIQGFVGGLSPTEPYKVVNGDHSGDDVNKEESNIPPKEWTEVSEIDTMSAFLATDKEIDDVIQNVVESVQQIAKGQVNAENVGVKSRKRTKKKQSADAKNTAKSEKENESVGNKFPASSLDNTREVEHLSKGMKQANLANKGSINQLNGSNLEGEDTRVEDDLICTQFEKVQPHTLESNSEGRLLEAVANGNPSKSDHANEGTDDTEISGESNRINFNDYFVPHQHNHEIVGSREVLVDRATKVKGVDGEIKAKKKKKKYDAQGLNENHEVGANPQAGNSRTGEFQGSLSNAEAVNIMLQPNKDPLQVFENGVKSIQSSKYSKLNSTSGRSNAVKPSGTSTRAKNNRAASNSSMENSKNTSFLNKRVTRSQSRENGNHRDGRKPSTINSGEVVNHSQHEKSLIGVSSSIFKDDSDVASSNEDDTSDASTRTPSDKSLSSDYSDGESNADFNSSQNGSYSSKRKGESGKTLAKPLSLDMTLDMIFRSSSRYKKAKLTASQSQLEDTESQPVDFVPDSQANF